MADLLQQAITAIKAGDKATGRNLLSQYLKTDRDNPNAWLWLSAAVETVDQRRRCLNEVLRINPNHPQATAMLAKLQKPPTQAPPSKPVFDAEEEAVPSWQKQLAQAKPTYSPTPMVERFPAPESTVHTLTDNSKPSEKTTQTPARPLRGLTWYEVWLSVLPSPTEKSFQHILSDPKLSLDRGLIWIFCTALIQYLVVLGLMLAIWLPMIEGLATQAGTTFGVTASIRNASLLLFVVGVPVLASLYTLIYALQIAIQHLIARLFGGRGSYEELVFASAAYQAPLQLISIVAVFIPYLNFCAGPLLGIYAIVLMTNSLRAVYRMGVERALAVIFLPGIVMAIFCCIVGFAIQGPIQQMLLESMMQITPVP